MGDLLVGATAEVKISVLLEGILRPCYEICGLSVRHREITVCSVHCHGFAAIVFGPLRQKAVCFSFTSSPVLFMKFLSPFSVISGSSPLTSLHLSDSQSYCRFCEEELEREL